MTMTPIMVKYMLINFCHNFFNSPSFLSNAIITIYNHNLHCQPCLLASIASLIIPYYHSPIILILSFFWNVFFRTVVGHLGSFCLVRFCRRLPSNHFGSRFQPFLRGLMRQGRRFSGDVFPFYPFRRKFFLESHTGTRFFGC